MAEFIRYEGQIKVKCYDTDSGKMRWDVSAHDCTGYGWTRKEAMCNLRDALIRTYVDIDKTVQSMNFELGEPANG